MLEFQPIPSDGKEMGWQNFLDNLPRLCSERKPVGQELLELHRLTTYGVELQDYPDGVSEEAAFYILSREVVGAEVAALMDYVRSGVFNVLDAAEGRIIPGLRAKVDMPRIGNLRRYGFVQRGNQQEETVYVSHAKPFYQPDGSILYFLGLAKGLGEVFDAFCKKCEELEEQYRNGTFEEKLKVVIFAQLWGVSVIHPFYDANGRTFNAKLVLDMNRILGFGERKAPDMGDIDPRFSGSLLGLAGEKFLEAFLKQSGIRFFSEDESSRLLLEPYVEADYMRRFKIGALNGIGHGISPPDPYKYFIDGAADLLKQYLGVRGFIGKEDCNNGSAAGLRTASDAEQKFKARVMAIISKCNSLDDLRDLLDGKKGEIPEDVKSFICDFLEGLRKKNSSL